MTLLWPTRCVYFVSNCSGALIFSENTYTCMWCRFWKLLNDAGELYARGVARKLFWGGITVFGKYKTNTHVQLPL